MRLALFSNVTVELLAGMLKKEHSIWVPSGFGAWIQTALAPPDDLREFDPEFLFLLLRARVGKLFAKLFGKLDDVEFAEQFANRLGAQFRFKRVGTVFFAVFAVFSLSERFEDFSELWPVLTPMKIGLHKTEVEQKPELHTLV